MTTDVYGDATQMGKVIGAKQLAQQFEIEAEKRKEEETYLVTGNLKHFPMRTYVVSPREMMEIVREGR